MICKEFVDLLAFAHDLKEGVAQLHTMQENIAAKVNNVSAIIRIRQEDTVSIQDVLKHLKELCTKSYGTTSTCLDQVKYKIEELKAKLN